MRRAQEEWLSYAAKHGLVEAAVCADWVNGNPHLLPKVNNPMPEEEKNRLAKSKRQAVIPRPLLVIDDCLSIGNHGCDCGLCEDCEAHFQQLLHFRN